MFRRTHYDPGCEYCAMLMQPLCDFNIAMQQRTAECMLKIFCTEGSNCFDHVEQAHICGMTHGRSPIAAPDRHMQ